MTPETLPVLIVGAGPVGLYAAIELDAHGVPVVIVEPRTAVEHSRPRAKTTSARTMEYFRTRGIAERVRSAAPLAADWSQRVSFVTRVVGREITHLDDCLGLGVSAQVSPERGQQVSQGVIEEVLRDAVAQRPGITTLFGWTATDIRSDGEVVAVSVRNAQGDERVLRASWLIGADGARSIVRRAMGAVFDGAPGGRPNVNISFRSDELAGVIPHAPSIHYWVLDPESPGVVGPLDRSGRWWAIATGTEHVRDARHAERIVRDLVGAAIDVDVIATDPWQARMLLADRYRNGRMFVVGDAAHQNPPWGGHGFNTGIGDAVNLAWKLAAVIRGWAPQQLLDSYESERRPVAAQTIEVAERNMRALPMDLAAESTTSSAATADAAKRIRELKGPEFYADGLVFGYGYTERARAQSPTLADYVPMVAAGNRLPHRLIDGRPVLDLLGPEFTVIGPSAQTRALLDAATTGHVPIHHVEAPGDVVLVRPDHHIAWTGAAAEDTAGRVIEDALLGFAEPSGAASPAVGVAG